MSRPFLFVTKLCIVSQGVGSPLFKPSPTWPVSHSSLKKCHPPPFWGNFFFGIDRGDRYVILPLGRWSTQDHQKVFGILYWAWTGVRGPPTKYWPPQTSRPPQIFSSYSPPHWLGAPKNSKKLIGTPIEFEILEIKKQGPLRRRKLQF